VNADNNFSRQTGLEVVSPAVRRLEADRSTVPVGETTTVSWDATNNPPGSTVRLVVARGGGLPRLVEPLPLTGSYPLEITEPGLHQISLEVRTGRTQVDRPSITTLAVTGAG